MLIFSILPFLIAVVITYLFVRFFYKYINKILQRIYKDNSSHSRTAAMKAVIIAIIISGIVRIWEIEKIIDGSSLHTNLFTINKNNLFLGLFTIIIDTLQSIAWIIILFFVIDLIVYKIARKKKMNKENILNEKR